MTQILPLVTTDEVKAWAPGPHDAGGDAVLTVCIQAASDIIGHVAGRLFGGPYTITGQRLDGSLAHGRDSNILYLPAAHTPVKASPLPTVTENGVSLTVADGYSTTADVLAVGLGEDGVQVKLVRRVTCWADGLSNIVTGYEVGQDGDAADGGIKQVAVELTWLLVREGRRSGIGQMSKQGTGLALLRELSPYAKAMLEARRIYRW